MLLAKPIIDADLFGQLLKVNAQSYHTLFSVGDQSYQHGHKGQFVLGNKVKKACPDKDCIYKIYGTN